MSLDILDIPELHARNEYSPVEVRTACGIVRIRPASTAEEIWLAEDLWRIAAMKGDGFALDEFTSKGSLNRKFFTKPDVIIAENVSGNIIGTAIVGKTKLTRDDNNIGHCYVATDDKYQGQGIGKALLDYSLTTMQQQKYKGCIIDTFINNHKMHKLLTKRDFRVYGTIPLAGYVKNQGPTDSWLFYRDLKYI